MNHFIAERFNSESESEPDEGRKGMFEKNSRGFVSVTARWRERVSAANKLQDTMQQWCQEATHEMIDLDRHAEVAFGLKCSTRRNVKCERTLCRAFEVLKESCETFLNSKKSHACAEIALAAARTRHAEVEVQPDESENRLISSLTILEELVASRNENVAARSEIVASKSGEVAFHAIVISKSHIQLKCLLGAIEIAANEGSVVTTIGSKSASKSHDTGDSGIDPVVSSPTSLDKLCDISPREVDAADFLPGLSRHNAGLLVPFYEHLKLGFGKASILNDKDAEYRQRINETVDGIIGFSVNESPNQSIFYAPGCECQEKKGVQPILYAIMVKLVQLVGNGKHITREQAIAKVKNRKARVVDFVVTLVREYFLAIIPAMLGIPIEVKPITRKKKTVDQLLLEALNQVVGHLAKHAMFAVNQGGIGEDCKFFGLELTMGSVAVIVLELSGVGTADVNVKAWRTKRSPLFDKATREHLFGKNAKDVEASLENLEDEFGMPAGFCLLARMLLSVERGSGNFLVVNSKRNHGCFSIRSLRPLRPAPVKLGRYLGSGSFSHVLTLVIKGRYDVFAKVPKSHRMKKAMEREVKALKAVGGHACIPELFDPKDPVKTLDIHIRCEISAMACLPLVGLIGRPTNHDYSPWESSALEIIFKKVYDALKYAHHKHWAHLDVRPANIITSFNVTRLTFEVMLVDWGCAHRNDQGLKGFVGCPPYAHNDLFGLKKKWTPSLDHDLASLVYSVASLSHGSIPWSGFSNHHAVTDDARNNRRDTVGNVWAPLLKEWKLSREDEDAILHAIFHHKHETRKRKRVVADPQRPTKRRAIDRNEPRRVPSPGESEYTPIRPSRASSRRGVGGRRRSRK